MGKAVKGLTDGAEAGTLRVRVQQQGLRTTHSSAPLDRAKNKNCLGVQHSVNITQFLHATFRQEGRGPKRNCLKVHNKLVASDLP